MAAVLGAGVSEVILWSIDGPITVGAAHRRAEVWSRSDSGLIHYDVPGDSRWIRTLACGAADSYFVHRSEFAIDRAIPVAGAISKAHDALAKERRSRAEKRSLETVKERWLRQLRDLGRPPWENDRFQIVSLPMSRSSLTVVGRAYTPSATPEETVRWYGSRSGNGADAKHRDLALVEARRAEVELRFARDSLWRAICSGAEGEEVKIAAYAVMGRRLHVVKMGRNTEMDTLGKRVESTLDRCLAELRILVRQGGE